MGKKAELFISESLSSLKQALSKEKNQIGKRRIQSLIFIKEEKFDTRQHLADYLCIHIRTLEKWLVRYKSTGLLGMVSVHRKSRRSQEMDGEIYQALAERLAQTQGCFASYKEALLWTNETYQRDFKYSWFRKYLIKHLGTKLKVPRKSHIEKDEKAEAIFLKSSPHVLEK